MIPKGPLWRFVSGTLESSSSPTYTTKVAVPSRYSVLGSREDISKYPLGVTNYNFGGSCEATAVDALVHANTRSIPFPLPGSSLTPLCHPTPSNLPSLFGSLSRSLPPSLSSSPSLFPSLIPPGGNLFLSRARRSLSLYLPPEPTSPSRDGDSLSLGTLALSHATLSPRPFCGMARVLDIGGAPGAFDRSIEP